MCCWRRVACPVLTLGGGSSGWLLCFFHALGIVPTIVGVHYHITAIINWTRFTINVNAKQKWTQYRTLRNSTFYSFPSWRIIACSWFQTFAVFWIMYLFFWVFPQRQIVICRRFGTLCQFHLQMLWSTEWVVKPSQTKVLTGGGKRENHSTHKPSQAKPKC
jgi:hypothetical protein